MQIRYVSSSQHSYRRLINAKSTKPIVRSSCPIQLRIKPALTSSCP